MVESIGSTPLSGSGSVARVAAPAAAPAVQPAVQQAAQQAAQPAPPPEVSAQLSGLAKSLAASPPVNGDRVTEIKRAIANGSFPILPATIADRLLALSLNWNGHETA